MAQKGTLISRSLHFVFISIQKEPVTKHSAHLVFHYFFCLKPTKNIVLYLKCVVLLKQNSQLLPNSKKASGAYILR